MILGFGIPTCIVAGSSLIGELGYPKERPILTSLFNVAYFVGSIVAASICFGTNNIKSNWGWRLPSILQICPSVLQITFVLYVTQADDVANANLTQISPRKSSMASLQRPH